MKYSILRYLVLIWICTAIGLSTFAQSFYMVRSSGASLELVRFDMTTCESHILKDLADYYELDYYGALEMSFHPDGYLYITTFTDTHDVFKIFRYQPHSQTIEEYTILDPPDPTHQIAIFEEGNAILSWGNNSPSTLIYEYDLRKREVLREIDLPGLPTIAKNIYGVVKDNNLIFGSAANQYSTGIWYKDAQKFDSTTFQSDQYYNLSKPSIYYPACGHWQLISSRALDRNRGAHLVVMDTVTKTIEEWCSGTYFSISSRRTATTTDFRQSALRIDLDSDNSSGHITAGYYDTLYTCNKMAPITDKDIGIYTCGAEVDYISFRLKYFDQPRLPAEYITAEGYEDQLRQTSPSRWEWQNPYGDDTVRIKDFLRSVRYHADWENPNERERAVAITMHVGEDSTSSWSVYQLERDEVYAGRDTMVEYCGGSSSVDLRSFLSGDALAGGHFDPEPSGGDGLFVPGSDPDGKYRYIVESQGCMDTAVLNVQELYVSSIGLDTVYLCSGARLRIGFPPGKFTDIRWWDGSSGDSIWVQETMDVMRQVNVTYGNCGLNITLHILMQDPGELAGPDTTLSYCPAAQEIDLSTFLPAPPGSTTLEPALQSNSMVFTPGSDPPGTYAYIVSSGGGCADTALIILEESATQELPFDDVRLCSDEDVRIGLPSGDYENVRWWNGETGDSTTITSGDTGPFTVEAQSSTGPGGQDGCTFSGFFDVIIQENIEFPDGYPDTLEICPGELKEITVRELDSIRQQGNTYLSGDQILFSQPGDYVLTGYTGGCSTSKTITITAPPDPSNDYSETIFWCEGTPLTLSLPKDSAGLTFSWSDGLAARARSVTTTGEYLIDILSGSCTFQGNYTVVANDASECDTQECTVSIPNAITPNGDGRNDGLEIFLTPGCGSVESITLWDKWGGLRYQTSSANLGTEAWEGLPSGIYIVQVTYENESGKRMTETGSVLVIK